MSEKVIKGEELIEKDVFKDTRESAEKTMPVMKEFISLFESFLKNTQQKVKSNPLGSAQDIADLNAAMAAAKPVAESLLKTKVDLQKAEAALNQVYDQQAGSVTRDAVELQKLRIQKNEAMKQAKDLAREELGLNNAYKQKSDTLNKLREQYKNLAAQNKENTKEGRELLKSVTTLDKELKKIDDTVGQHQRHVGGYKQALEGLPGPFGQAVAGAKALGVQLLKLLANPIVATIAAITLGLTLLFKAFTKSDEGATGFAAIMEQIGAITDVVMQRLGSFASGVMNLFKGNWKQASNDFSASIKGVADQLKNATEAAKAYIYELDRIEDAENSYTSQAAVNRNKIAKLEFEAADKSKSLDARRKALKEAMRLGEEETAREAEFLRERYENELNYAAAKYNIDREVLKNFIEVDDAQGQIMLDNNQELRDARNKMNDEGQKKLEESYSKTVDAQTKFFDENKRNNSKLTGFDEDAQKQREEAAKKALEKKEKDFKDAQQKIIDDDNWNAKHDEQKSKEREEWNKKEAEKAKKYAEYEASEVKRLQDIADKEQDARDKDKEAKAKLQKENRLEQEKELFDTAKKYADEYYKNEEDKINRSIENSKRRESELKQLAAMGVDNAKESIALEQKNQAEAEEKRQELERKKIKMQFAYDTLKLEVANLEANPGNPGKATLDTFAQMTAIAAFAATMPGFYEGTESVAESLGKPQLPGRDGHIIRVDGREGILNPEDNATRGDLTNKELVNLGAMYNAGLLMPIQAIQPMFVSTNTNDVVQELRAVKEAVKNIDITNVTMNYDALNDVFTVKRDSRHRVINEHTRPQKGIWS